MQIVWDQEKKKWVNLEGDGNEETTELKPPPKMSDMIENMQPPHTNYSTMLGNQVQIPYQTNVTSVPNQSGYGMEQNNVQKPNTVGIGAQNLNSSSAFQPVKSNDDEQPKTLQPNMFKMQRARSELQFVFAVKRNIFSYNFTLITKVVHNFIV